jgi:hypothetical protein
MSFQETGAMDRNKRARFIKRFIAPMMTHDLARQLLIHVNRSPHPVAIAWGDNLGFTGTIALDRQQAVGGQGSGAVVFIDETTPDWANLKTIAANPDVGLFHELLHVRHIQRGTVVNDEREMEHRVIGIGRYLNAKGTENDYRQERSLPLRCCWERESLQGLAGQTRPGLGYLGQGEIDQAISMAKRQMQVHVERRDKYVVGAVKTNDGTAAAREAAKYWEWSRERDFLEWLKAVYESQAGIPLSYTHYPVTKVDPISKKIDKNNPWRFSAIRQPFKQEEANGSFCLGTSRAMAFRTLFGLDKPKNRAILQDLKAKIEAAKAAGDMQTEARLLINRIVLHLHDPGSMNQFNQDLPARYGIKNTIVRNASRSQAFEALKRGAPIIADLEGGWHWVLVQRSPRGQLWANDPLPYRGVRRISANDLGSRFELIVDATTGEPITPNKAGTYQK